MLPQSDRHPDNGDEPTSRAGFTMIEALVALSVIAISLAAIGSLVAGNVRATRRVDNRLSVVETARAVLTGLPDRGDLAPGDLSGAMGDNNWRVDVLPFSADFVDPQQATQWVPQAVVIRVESPTGQELRLDTVRLRPAGGGRP
jgi:general secretion pathway protein I